MGNPGPSTASADDPDAEERFVFHEHWIFARGFGSRVQKLLPWRLKTYIIGVNSNLGCSNCALLREQLQVNLTSSSKTLLSIGTAALLGIGISLHAAPAVPPKAAAAQKLKAVAVDAAGFDANVKPILKNTCSGCHNAAVTSGGVNLRSLPRSNDGDGRSPVVGQNCSEDRIGRDAAKGDAASAAGQSYRAHYLY